MTLSLRVLGCGSSGGVPRIGEQWGACDPGEPRNRRRRCSVLVERRSARGKTTVLIDMSPDLRAQMLDARVEQLDAVLVTHDHADHTHGIDELRIFTFLQKKRVPLYMDAFTLETVVRRFDYCFATPKGSSYPPIVKAIKIEPGREVVIAGPGGEIVFLPILQTHGDIHSLGFRFGRGTVYSPDISDVPDASLAQLQGLDLWIVDALRPTYHPSHFSLSDSLEWIARLRPAKAVLTHLHIDMDYETLCAELPEHVRPAYDGMVLEIAE